jgi:hypothetical protein
VANRILHIAFATAWAVAATAHAQYTGATACRGCHPAQFARQASTGHARSMHTAASHPLVSWFAKAEWVERSPGFRMRLNRPAEDSLRLEAYDSANTLDIPVEWAFGAGDQAVTFVTRIDANWYLEHFLTYYAATGRLAATPGHAALTPKSLAEAVGLPYKTSDPEVGILGCFECHSTGPVQVSAEGELSPREAGVRCEACHGPGAAHVAAAGKGNKQAALAALRNPKNLTPAELNTFCGRCHRPPESAGSEIDWTYAWNVRHQPVYLSRSRCQIESGAKLTCFTCHEPHSPLERATAASSYNARCRDCHNGTGAGRRTKACGGNASNCVDCHMPRVSPQSPLRFTNHWIGVYLDGAGLKPR